MTEKDAKNIVEKMNKNYSENDPLVGKYLTSYYADGGIQDNKKIVLIDRHPEGLKEGYVNVMLSDGHIVTNKYSELKTD